MNFFEKSPAGKCKDTPCKQLCGISSDIHIEEAVTEGGEMVICSICRFIITSTSEIIAVNGAYNHSFANPHGLFFDISCYKNAKGCIHSEIESNEFSWFRGHSWRVVTCKGCKNHIGWLFTGAVSSFYGLISDKLIISRSDKA